MAIGAVEGHKAEERVVSAGPRFQIIHCAVGEEIHRMTLMDGFAAILDHPVAVKADRVAMREGDPMVIVRGRVPWLAKMIFADQGGAVAGLFQPSGKGREFADGVPVLRPL